MLSAAVAGFASAQTSVQTDDRRLSGGLTTVFSSHAGAFSLNSANMSSRRKGDFLIGNDFFEDPWVIAPATTDLRDGLGPLFNVSACQSCHFNDGRGHAPSSATDDADSMLIRLSRMPVESRIIAAMQKGEIAAFEDPVYGGQLQNRGNPGIRAEAQIRVHYKDRPVTFKDGTTLVLRDPVFQLQDWGYGEPPEGLVLSMRVAPPVIGMGLLEAIAETDLAALQDLDDRDGNGISGKLARVWDIEKQAVVAGRFGWKAGQPTVRQQSAGAFNGDMGLTSSLFPVDGCTSVQVECLQAPHGKDAVTGIEVRDDILDFVTHYVSNLAVPARRNLDDPAVQKGYGLFAQAGCLGCHVERYQTERQPPSRIEQSEQIIFPFTDLLLHDMGPDLADRLLDGSPAEASHLTEYQATASEWRTPPLWGIGLSHIVNPNATFLHDGRARTLMEAVLWHGGEAEASKQKVLTFDQSQRDALHAFLNSL